MRARPLCLPFLFSLTLFAPLSSGCVEHDEPLDYGDPTALNSPSTEDGIVAYVVEPTASTPLTSPKADLVIAAYTTGTPRPLRVSVETRTGQRRTAQPSGSPGAGQRFRASVPLLHGVNAIGVAIEAQDGSKFRKLSYALLYDGAPPGVDLKLLAPGPDGSCDGATPIDEGVTAAQVACVEGRVTTHSGGAAKSVSVGVSGGQQGDVELGQLGVFRGQVQLTPGQKNTVEATAVDGAGAKTTARADVVQDASPPAVALTAPGPGPEFRTDDESISLEGTVSDDLGVASVRVETPDGGGEGAELDAAGQAAEQGWKAQLKLVPGPNKLFVVARDLGGNATKLPITVTRARVHRLDAPQKNQGSTTLSLDKVALSSLLTEADQKNLKLATIGLRPSIVSALNAIRDPEKYGVDTGAWGSAEKNLSVLLNMTPDTANLKGSSVEELLGIAAAVGLPPPRVLADLLGIDVTTTFVGPEVTADVLMAQLIGNHPNIEKDDKGQPAITVSLYDVFQDLHPLAARFGPVGSHPGFLSGATESKVLEPGFRMQVPVRSNLTQYDGIDASADSKSALFLLTGDKVLELDFSSNDFSIVGLADEPALDLKIGIKENPAFLHAGDDKAAGADPDNPGFYRGNSPVWQAEPWEIERIVAETAYRQNRPLFGPSFTRQLSYDAGSIKKAAQIDWDHGWVTIMTAGGIGSPPPPQYAWDILLETAQIRLHDGGLAEGQADLAFALKGLSIGLTADDLIAATKPQLQKQASDLSKLIAGTSGLADSGCDVYFVPSEPSGSGFLFFRAAGDSQKPYAYAQPGFFADAQLKQKVSQAGAQAGTADSTHEKIPAQKGTKVYFRDDGAQVYSLEILDVDAQGVSVRTEPVKP